MNWFAVGVALLLLMTAPAAAQPAGGDIGGAPDFVGDILGGIGDIVGNIGGFLDGLFDSIPGLGGENQNATSNT